MARQNDIKDLDKKLQEVEIAIQIVKKAIEEIKEINARIESRQNIV